MNKLVIGAAGQIGGELILALQEKYPNSKVVAADIRELEGINVDFEKLDCRDLERFSEIVEKHSITTIFHLPALLSATAEEKPLLAWDVNMNGVLNVLEVAKKYGCSVFVPSTIGVFGESTPKENTPQETTMRPSTMYGITKIAAELLCDYYHKKFNVDARSLRLPGIISYKTLPGGGTTDYAVDIFYKAIESKKYTSYLSKETKLDMMYMPDLMKAIIGLMEAPSEDLITRNGYNLASLSFNPEQLAAEIRKEIPEFEISYEIDPIRQSIADSWPDNMDDQQARKEWNWLPSYDLQKMVKEMLQEVAKK